MRIMISGGGTGGHIFPALAIAEALRRRVPGVEILFVGAKGRMEMEKVPAAGYKIEGLWISGLDRQKILKNLTFPLKVVSSLTRSFQLIRRFRPDVIVGVGGFASGPLLEAGARMKIPTLIHEQNSYAGITNKILSKKADRICVAFSGMEKYFPEEKILLTGNPIRQDLLEKKYSSEEARTKLGIQPGRKTILSLGGSLGARTLNQMFRDQTVLIAEQADTHFIWQYGSLYEEEYGTCDTARLENVTAVKFIEDMSLVYAAADLVVARAGALTLTELAALGKAAVLIPSPNVAEDHQTKNARQLENGGAAVLIKDEEARDTGIATLIDMIRKEEKLNILRKNIISFYREGADEVIAEEILKLAKAS